MLSSSRRINYSLRPAKQIERKMLCEAFRSLTTFSPLAEYQYIGMGALQFADFTMIHKELGITSLFSIEGDPDRDRFVFNKPFECVEMLFGLSTDVLRTRVDWTVPTIMWLDYDYRLVPSVLADVELFLRNAIAGSLLLVTVDAEEDQIYSGGDPARSDAEAETEGSLDGMNQRPHAILTSDFPDSAALAGESDATLVGWNIAVVYARLIFDAINQITAQELRPDGAKFEQLFHFEYLDTARMVTIGGLLSPADRAQEVLTTWSTDTFSFVRTSGTAPYRIDLPRLTYREGQWLNQFLPTSNGQDPVPVEDRERYATLYRWFPTFAEIDL